MGPSRPFVSFLALSFLFHLLFLVVFVSVALLMRVCCSVSFCVSSVYVLVVWENWLVGTREAGNNIMPISTIVSGKLNIAPQRVWHVVYIGICCMCACFAHHVGKFMFWWARCSDRQRVLGVVLLGTWHPARWSDAFWQDYRRRWWCFQHVARMRWGKSWPSGQLFVMNAELKSPHW